MSADPVFLPAAQYIADIETTCEHLAAFPHLGRRHDERYFYIVSRNHLIFYRYDRDRDTLTIARIIHGARNIPDHI